MAIKFGRRAFLAAGVTVGSAGLTRAAVAAGRADLGIQMYSLRGFPVEEALHHARDLGLKVVEFYSGMFPVTEDEAAIEAMKRKVAALGLAISAYGVVPFTQDDDANRRTFAFAKRAGIPTIVADPEPGSFTSLDRLVKEYDIRVAVHNHGPKHRYDKVLDVLQAIDKHDARIGACADLGHFIRSGEKPVEVIRLLAGRLYGIHLKDFADMAEKTKGVILGQGHLDVPAVFAALDQAKFPADGALSLEYEEHPANPLADLRECVRVAREAMAGA
jgi:sugar phosphate isomerase/epimerase